MSIHKVEKLVLCNFLLIYAIGRIFSSFLGIDLHYIQIFHFIIGICGITYLFRKGVASFDYLVLFYMAYLLLNGLFIDYNNHWSYLYRTLPTAIVGIFFFFVGRHSRISTINILRGMKWPWVVLSIIGIYCFFMLPSWYTRMKMAQIVSDNLEHIMGIYRLSAIWGHPYQMTYATFLFGVYLIASLTNNQEKKKYLWALLLLCVIILLLGQIRVTIFGFILSFFILFILRAKDNWFKWGISLLLLLFIINVTLTIISTVDVDNYKYMMEHMLSLSNKNAIYDRLDYTSGGITDYSIWGNGYGRYGFEAREHNLFAIVDCEYQKHLAEVGYFGMFLLSVLLIFTFLKALIDKNLNVDFCVFLFYCIAMIGASVLSNTSQYGFMFWFCMGKLWKSNHSRESLALLKLIEKVKRKRTLEYLIQRKK